MDLEMYLAMQKGNILYVALVKAIGILQNV